MDLTTATPIEFDTALAALYGQQAKARVQADQTYDFLAREVARLLGRGYRDIATQREVTEYLIDTEGQTDYASKKAHEKWERYLDHMATVDEVSLEIDLFNDAFLDRGGWTRAFLVNSSNGHVHSSMVCSTCYANTAYHWIVEMADHDEAEIVEKAGARACTVCYPSAPVEVLARPTQFFTPDEQAKAEQRERREAAKAAREAAQVVVENWQDGIRFVTKVFKTERGLTNVLASTLQSLCWYGEDHSSADEWLWNVEQGRKALPSWDYEKALAAARKKVARDGGQARY